MEPRLPRWRQGHMHRFFGLASLAFSLVVVGCAMQPAASSSSGTGTGQGTIDVTGSVVAGPTCPVVTEPPQSGCEARPVPSAVLLVIDADGSEVARVTSAADGTFGVSLAPGRYRLVPKPVEGLMGTAPEQAFTVGEQDPKLTVTYDTGIR